MMHPGSMTSASEFVYIQSTFGHMEEALSHSTYMMMIMTERFCADSWAELQRDECLMESINNPHKRWSVIPLIATTFLPPSKQGDCVLPVSVCLSVCLLDYSNVVIRF